MNYTVIYEATPTGYLAYVPDLPGCVAAGSSREEVETLSARQSGSTSVYCVTWVNPCLSRPRNLEW